MIIVSGETDCWVEDEESYNFNIFYRKVIYFLITLDQGCATHGPRATIRPSRPVNVALDDGRTKKFLFKSIYLAICTVYMALHKNPILFIAESTTQGVKDVVL